MEKQENQQKEEKKQEVTKEQVEEVRRKLETVTLLSELPLEQQRQIMSLFKTNDPQKINDELNKKRDFWDSQPVPKLKDYLLEAHKQVEGPLEIKKVSDVKVEPYLLPAAFEWCDIDLEDQNQIQQVYTLLFENYVEDDDNMFRFDYSKEFLRWALLVPGQFKDWIMGIRVKANRKLVAFISAIPVHINIKQQQQQQQQQQQNVHKIKMAEVNFLCVHKKIRQHRLAPVLIKEITRRVNLRDQWQAIYTAGVLIPSPYAVAQYWHRSLNPKKLIECKFSCLGRNQTISRVIKLYKLPEESTITNIRIMKNKDISQVCKLLNQYLENNSRVYLKFTEEDVKHFLLPREQVIYSYVVENNKSVTDFVSFYNLPSSVLQNPKYTHINAAYSYYHVANTLSLKQLIYEALILAKKENFDVFNALDIMENKQFINELSFSAGDGYLHYYMYNYQMGRMLDSKDLGIVLV